jgi:hypothetical protein
MFELYIKYLLEGIAVAVAAYFIPRKKVEISEIIFIALSAAATFAVLDIFAPKVGDGARKGAGFGIGANTVGWPMGGAENFNGKSDETMDSDDSSKSDDSDDSTDSSEPEHFEQKMMMGGKTPMKPSKKSKGKKAGAKKPEPMKKEHFKASTMTKEERNKIMYGKGFKSVSIGASVTVPKGENFEDSSVASTVASTVSSAVSTVTGSSDSKSADTKSTETKSVETKSTETKSMDSSMMSMDSTGSAVMGYDETKQYSSF